MMPRDASLSDSYKTVGGGFPVHTDGAARISRVDFEQTLIGIFSAPNNPQHIFTQLFSTVEYDMIKLYSEECRNRAFRLVIQS